MGIAAKAGETASVQANFVATAARDLQKYDIVHCGDGVLRTVEEVLTLPPERSGRAVDQTRVSWLGTFGYMFVQADEVFWVHPHTPISIHC